MSLEQADLGYVGSTFREVRDQVFSDPYDELPSYVITLATLYSGLKNTLLTAARRALVEPNDIVPWFQRRVHPNGIALTGVWRMTEESPYTGYFARGSEGLIVVRSSVLLYKTTREANRGFAFAGKIFPTMDPDERVRTADFFTIDVLAGSLAPNYTRVELTNHPPLGFNLELIPLFWVIMVTFSSFIRADLNPVFRPVYPVAELGLIETDDAVSPRWMMVKARPGCGLVDQSDFRDELQVENYQNGKLVFDVSVASRKSKSGSREWHVVGEIVLDESVVSDSCDHRLKFRHPKLKRG